MEEIWKDIPGYENYYQASSMGKIRSVCRSHSIHSKTRGDYTRNRTSQLMMQTIVPNGYLQVMLQKNKRRVMHRAHRLIALTFLEKKSGKPLVNHINGVKTDNQVSNLEWCNQSYNSKHAYRVLGVKNVHCREIICITTGQIFPSLTEAARQIKGNHSLISAVCMGKRNTHLGLKFKYMEKK